MPLKDGRQPLMSRKEVQEKAYSWTVSTPQAARFTLGLSSRVAVVMLCDAVML